MSKREQITEVYDEEILFLEPAEQYDPCIVGVAYRCGMEPVVVYDVDQVLEALVQDGMDREEAEEWFEFNIAGAYVGERTPLFLVRVSDEAGA